MKNPFTNITWPWMKTVRDINRKYRKPRLTMTKAVRLSLLVLRIYLLVLVLLIIYKFITLIR